MTNINICTNITRVIHETQFIDKTQDWISIDHLPKCRSYLLEISAVNGWTNNDGVGKSAFRSFRYSPERTTTVTITPTQISRTSLLVTLNNLPDNCDPIGYILELINENNQSNCEVRIINIANCCDIISQHSICPNKQCQILSNKSQQSINVFFIGLIQEPMKYLIKVSSVSDVIHDAIQVELSSSQMIKDCFTDCHENNKYFGMRSSDKNGKSCISWKSTKYEGTYPNICSFAGGTNYPWCYTELSTWSECDIPVCSTVTTVTGCIIINQIISSTESLTIKWISPTSQYYHHKLFGYITLLHNNDHSCTHYHIQLCNNCGSHDQFSSKIKNIYSSCKSSQIINEINQISHFNGLHQNQQYIVYVIPIINLSEIGEVRNVTIHTKLAKPITPQNIRTTSQSVNSITLSWNKENNFTKHGQPDHYLISVLQNNSQIIHQKISIESIDINNLNICSRYCFLLRSENAAGTSEISQIKCWNTLAPKPDNVKFAEIQSGYFTKQTFSWKYLGEDKCSKKYRLRYQMKHDDNSVKYLETNQTTITIDNLQTNLNYTITIQAENNLQTINNSNIGEYSESQQFYTGLVNLNLSYYNEIINSNYKSLNISWGIIDEMRGALFEYLIIVRNSSGFCIYSINFQCDDCQSPWNLNSQTEEQQQSRNNLIKCQTKQFTNFNFNDISFHYLITSESIFSNFSVEIYGIYLLGIYQLNQKMTMMIYTKNFQQWIPLICICAILILLIILFFINRKSIFKAVFQNSFNIHPLFPVTKNIRKKRFSISSDKINQIKLNVPCLESTTQLILIEQSKTFSNNQKQSISKTKTLETGIDISSYREYFDRVSKNKNSEFIKEYKKLAMESKTQETYLQLTFEAGKDPINSKKNRFVNILPFDQNRVKVGNRGYPYDYINANYIPFVNNERKIEYIASQGPIEDSLSDFWQMIWEQNINCIIMLTQTMEDDKFKCVQYWPDNACENVSYGYNNQYKVTLLNSEDKEGHIERELLVLNIESNEQRNIIHLHMHTWFDHSAPNLDYFDKLLFKFHELANNKAQYPYLVHCSAGVGRTGTLICIDRIIKQLVNGGQKINIYQVVLKLRSYRNIMVQRQAQYVFIHEYINHFVSKYMQLDGPEETTYFNET